MVPPQVIHLEPLLVILQVFLFVFARLYVVPGVAVALWGIDALFVCTIVLVPFPPDTGVYYAC